MSTKLFVLLVIFLEFVIAGIYIAFKIWRLRKASDSLKPLKEYSSIVDILSIFDKIYSTKKANEYLEMRKRYDNDELIVKELLSATTEDGIVAIIEHLSESYNTLPKIHTLSRVVAEANSQFADKPSQIRYLLETIDKSYGTEYAAEFESSVNKNLEYDSTVPYLNDIKGITGEFDCSVKAITESDNQNYWSRLALVLLSLDKLVFPVLKLDGMDQLLEPQKESILNNLKEDLIQSYILRYFLRDSADGNISPEQFAVNTMDGVNQAIAAFNTTWADKNRHIEINADEDTLLEKIAQLQVAMGKIRYSEQTQPFIDRMWEFFVKDFLKDAKEKIGDKAYLFQNALNIAYHTADFLDHIKGNRDIEYCSNYNLLLNDLNVDMAKGREFIHNDYSKSTTYSDFVYECAESTGIEHLKILVDNYNIMP